MTFKCFVSKVRSCDRVTAGAADHLDDANHLTPGVSTVCGGSCDFETEVLLYQFVLADIL